MSVNIVLPEKADRWAYYEFVGGTLIEHQENRYLKSTLIARIPEGATLEIE